MNYFTELQERIREIRISERFLYQNSEGSIKIDVRLEEETVWLTQDQMAALFGKARTTITEHIQNVFKEGELNEDVVCRNFRLTTQHGAIEGKTQEVSENITTSMSQYPRCPALARTSKEKMEQWHLINKEENV